MKIGLQLYNFREALSADFRGALKEISKIGFDGVEFAVAYGNIPPAELAAYLKELGLECCGTMFAKDAMLDPANICWEYVEALKTPAVTHSASGDFTKIYKDLIETSTVIGKNAAAHGVVFAYHNHWLEFTDVDGKTAMDRILEATDPANVYMEPDVCWLTRAGVKPAEFLKKYEDRIVQIHVKDIGVPEDPDTTAVLGTGVVDLASVIAAAKTMPKCQWLTYEQDNSADPFQSAADSLAFLRKNI